MKKRPDTDWEIIDKEKVNLKQGYRNVPEAEYEQMESDEKMNRNESDRRHKE
jgi:hypothetical protein